MSSRAAGFSPRGVPDIGSRSGVRGTAQAEARGSAPVDLVPRL